jgi:hypothetical protein
MHHSWHIYWFIRNVCPSQNHISHISKKTCSYNLKHWQLYVKLYLHIRIRHQVLRQQSHHSELAIKCCFWPIDQWYNCIKWAVKSADKLIKAHCLPLDWTLKRSSPWYILEERNRAILTCIFPNIFDLLHPYEKLVNFFDSWSTWRCVGNTKPCFWPLPSFNKRSWSLMIPPGLRHLYKQTDKRSRSRQYIPRAKDWVEWTLEKPPRVKNSVLPRNY